MLQVEFAVEFAMEALNPCLEMNGTQAGEWRRQDE
jgi:hypothetical protein